MPKNKAQESFSLSKQERGLSCDACGKGYADCVCIPTWNTPEERVARTAEIHSIKAEALKNITGRAAPAIERSRLQVQFPQSLELTLRLSAEQEKESVSRIVERLLRSHSGMGERLISVGPQRRISLTLDRLLIKRTKTRACVEGVSPSEIIRKHLEKELYFELLTL